MNFTITSSLYQVGTVEYGWQLIGNVSRDIGITSIYESDYSLLSMLTIGTMYEYRLLLQNAGATVIEDNRTCFPTKIAADAIIPQLTLLLNRDMLYF